MKIKYIIIFLLLFLCGCNVSNQIAQKHFSHNFIGKFSDDYDIQHTITDSMWVQQPNIKYKLLKWNQKQQYFIAQNDAKNPTEANLYTRIDYMRFTNMQPYTWGFCLTTFNAKSIKEAEAVASADRNNPRKGCGKYPFSRMKRVE